MSKGLAHINEGEIFIDTHLFENAKNLLPEKFETVVTPTIKKLEMYTSIYNISTKNKRVIIPRSNEKQLTKKYFIKHLLGQLSFEILNV